MPPWRLTPLDLDDRQHTSGVGGTWQVPESWRVPGRWQSLKLFGDETTPFLFVLPNQEVGRKKRSPSRSIPSFKVQGMRFTVTDRDDEL
jgi:hypothetical protein